MSGDGVIIAYAIQQGFAVEVIDGSFKGMYGTSAWIVEGENSAGGTTV
jgi:hypothetical protein